MEYREAINILKTWRVTGDKEHEALNMAISALQEQEVKRLIESSLTQKPLDTISRTAAIDALKMDISIIPLAKAREYVREAIETIYNRFEELPSV